MVYFNEWDRFAAAWLRQLQADGLIPEGQVDERDICEVASADVAGIRRCHWFAGVGGWELALQQAGWPDAREVWTASLPCQPFSVAGKQKGEADERHLWPVFYRLVCECRPATLLGEQVPGAIRHGWLDRVFADLETEGYSCGSIVLGAHSTGASHIRQRLYWVATRVVADAMRESSQRNTRGLSSTQAGEHCTGQLDGRVSDRPGDGGSVGGLADARRIIGERVADEQRPAGEGATQREQEELHDQRCGPTRGLADPAGRGAGTAQQPRQRNGAESRGKTDRLGNANSTGHANGDGDARIHGEAGESGTGQAAVSACADSGGFWNDYIVWPCSDGKARRIPTEPLLFPLAHGIPNRVGMLRGAGNAICVPTAAEFVRAFLDAEGGVT